MYLSGEYKLVFIVSTDARKLTAETWFVRIISTFQEISGYKSSNSSTSRSLHNLEIHLERMQRILNSNNNNKAFRRRPENV